MSNSKRKAHCNKAKYPTIRSAQIALKRTISRANKRNPIVTDLAAYKCSYCDGYHVGRDRFKGINWDRLATFERALKERCVAQAKDRESAEQIAARL